ncbi:MAG: cytochrome P450 [Deltaproteobacteria bacterium]|nr:MAG: cytochrome P450 [Deltaproteobacteria bacterium]
MTAPLPPGPRGDLLLGSTLDFKEHPLHYIKYLHDAYGDVVRFRVGPSYWYLIAHPDHIWDAMTRRADVFLKPQVAKRLWDKFLGDGLLTTEGDAWKRLHKLVMPAFHRKRIAAYSEVMTAFSHRMVDAWAAGERRDFDEDMVQLTLEIVAKTLFDADVQEGAEVVGEAMHVIQREMIEHIHMPVPVPRWWPSARNKRKLKAIADMEGVVREVIDARRASLEDHGDLLSMLLLAKDENGEGLNDREVRDQAMTIFFAGHETTAHAMTWMWYLLARHPKVTERLVADIDRVTGGEPMTLAHLKELPYLEQCVKESMRILPSVWVFMKEPTEDVEVGGFLIPKGSQVMISPYVTQHDARWFPSPETFDPDRFEKERAKSIPAGAYIPFSGGQRICLGKSFAMMEAQLVIGSLLQRVVPSVPVDYKLSMKAELSNHPDGGMPVDIVFRDAPHEAVAK